MIYTYSYVLYIYTIVPVKRYRCNIPCVKSAWYGLIRGDGGGHLGLIKGGTGGHPDRRGGGRDQQELMVEVPLIQLFCIP